MFADEVDALLGRRRDHEHEAVTSMKTEFMQLWDGFLTESRANVMVLAATNRPYDLDEAVLRRRGLPITQLLQTLRSESGQGSCAKVLLVALNAATDTQHPVPCRFVEGCLLVVWTGSLCSARCQCQKPTSAKRFCGLFCRSTAGSRCTARTQWIAPFCRCRSCTAAVVRYS